MIRTDQELEATKSESFIFSDCLHNYAKQVGLKSFMPSQADTVLRSSACRMRSRSTCLATLVRLRSQKADKSRFLHDSAVPRDEASDHFFSIFSRSRASAG